MKWVRLLTASDQLTAEVWIDLLRNEGIPAMIRPSDAASYLGVSMFSCRVLVPEDRLAEAQRLVEETELVDEDDELPPGA